MKLHVKVALHSKVVSMLFKNFGCKNNSLQSYWNILFYKMGDRELRMLPCYPKVLRKWRPKLRILAMHQITVTYFVMNWYFLETNFSQTEALLAQNCTFITVTFTIVVYITNIKKRRWSVNLLSPCFLTIGEFVFV